MKVLDRIKEAFQDEERCKHYDIAEWPSLEKDIWYVLNENEKRTYWTETDVAYTKVRKIEREFICLGCGEETTIETEERIGGEDAIKVKSEMDKDELEKFQSGIHVPGFFNGFPEDHPFWSNVE